MVCFLIRFIDIKSEVMKTIKINTVSFLLAISLLGISINSFSQEYKLTRQEKQEIKKVRATSNFNILDSLLNTKQFVLEAEYLQDKYGNRIPVVTSLNFIKLNGSTGVLQTGSNSGLGYNGVGGATAEGTVSIWEISRDLKRYVFTIHFGLITNLGHYDVLMRVGSDNNASADITGLGPGKLTWVGHLKALNSSRIFKGQNSI
jgi:hypothetical protein